MERAAGHANASHMEVKTQLQGVAIFDPEITQSTVTEIEADHHHSLGPLAYGQTERN